jgi:prenyltransferase beta subunit
MKAKWSTARNALLTVGFDGCPGAGQLFCCPAFLLLHSKIKQTGVCKMKGSTMRKWVSVILVFVWMLAMLPLPAQTLAAVSEERLNGLAIQAAQNQYDLYRLPTPVDGGYGHFGAYDAYALKNAGADLSVWKQENLNLEDQLRALMDQTLQDPGAVSAKEAAYEFLAARAMGDAVREEALLQILIDRQIRDGEQKGGFDENQIYGNAPAFEALSRAGALDRIQAADAYDYLLQNWDETTGAWPQGYVDLMTTAQILRALNALKAYVPEAQSAAGALRIDAGMAWLQACQQPDGSFLNGEWDDPLVDTAEALMTLANAGLPLDAWNRDGVSGVDYIANAALNDDGTFGALGNIADNTAALEALQYAGATVDWSKITFANESGGNEGGSSGETPDTIAVGLEVTGPSGQVLYAPNTVRIGAENPSVFEALKQSGLSYQTTGGNFVTEIGGFANLGLNGWMYKVNGQFTTVSAMEYLLKEGDSLLWLYSEDPGNIADIGGGGSSGESGPVITSPSSPAPSSTPDTTAGQTAPALSETHILIKIGDSQAQVNDRTVTLDIPAYIRQGRAMAPLRFISEAMGAKISWLADSKEVVIEREPGPVQTTLLEEKATAAVKQILQSYQSRSQLSLWEGMVLASQGVPVPQNVTEDVLEEIRRQQGVYRLPTDYAKAILFLKSIGRDPKDVNGYNLVEKLYNLSDLLQQGVNGPVWALNALESEDIPADALWTRERLTEAILAYKNEDGGFPLSQGADSDVDLTAMVMAALAGENQADAAHAVLRAMGYLIQSQSEDGEFLNLNVKNSGSVSQVILALGKLGVNPLDPRFVKQGKTLVDVLLSYQTEDGRFKHTHDGEANDMATEQAVQALIQYGRFAAEQKGPQIVLKVQAHDLNPDMAPVIVADRVLVPVRFAAEKLGAQVRWDQAAQTVTILKP